MTDATPNDLKKAMAELGRGLFVVTAQHDGKRSGAVARSVQVCADEPPLICVALKKGHWIEPLIRDSHVFAVCRVSAADKLLLRKFNEPSRPRDGDPFDCVPTERMVTGAPVICKSSLVLDCQVVRHFDLEADHELFVAQVLVARMSQDPA